MSDLISRGDAIKAVLVSNLSACTVFGRSEEGMATAKELIQVIKNLPSVQPEPLTLRVNSELTKEEYDKLMQDIKDAPIVLLPSVQPEQRWIPCSERLPEDYEDVLVWFEYFRYGNYNCLYQMYGIGSYSSGYNSWLINQETGWNELKVFAWMHLPKPPKEEDE